MPGESTDHSERQRISSAQTFLLKWVFPVIWIGGFGAGALALWVGDSSGSRNPPPAEMKWIFLFAWVAGTSFIGWFSGRLMRIERDGDTLYVSNYWREIAVPVAQVMAISENRWMSGHPVTLTFRTSTPFGRSITFLPRVRMFGFLSSHPIVGELKRLANIEEAPHSPSPEPGALIAMVPGFAKWRSVLVRLNDAAPRKLLIANLCIALLVGLSNGGAVIIGGRVPGLTQGMREAALYYVVPGSFIVALSALFGLACRTCRERILAIHGLVLFAGLCAMAWWVLVLVIHGLPTRSFGWTPGLLEASAGYATFLLCRYSLPEAIRIRESVFYLPIVAGLLMIPLDIGAIVRLVGLMVTIMNNPGTFVPH